MITFDADADAARRCFRGEMIRPAARHRVARFFLSRLVRPYHGALCRREQLRPRISCREFRRVTSTADFAAA